MTTAEPFGARLCRALDRRGPLCVGIDPHPALLTAWGLPDDVSGLEAFTMTVVDALAREVAVLKPQSAFFERFGSAGVAVLERGIAAAREAGALVLLDAKRGDIGSTMAAYAAAFLGPGGPLRVDAVTLSPYLGYGSLRPALDLAREHGAGVFVLARTSNPEGPAPQRALRADGRTVAGAVLDDLAADNAGVTPLGSWGAVVGATVSDAAHGRLDGTDLDINGPLLAPGLGAQGARPADLPAVFGSALPAVLPSVSRDILGEGPDPARLRAAAERWTTEITSVIR